MVIQRRLRITIHSALNLGYEEWGKFLGNGPMAAALLSRLLQKCRTITFPKESVNLRNPKFRLPTSPPTPDVLKAD